MCVYVGVCVCMCVSVCVYPPRAAAFEDKHDLLLAKRVDGRRELLQFELDAIDQTFGGRAAQHERLVLCGR